MKKPKILEELDNLKTEQESHASQLAEKQTQIDNLDTNKAEKTEVNTLATAKADIAYVNTKVDSVANGAPDKTFTTLADLNTAYPTGDSKNKLLSSDGHIYNWNGSVWTDTGIQYQSTGIADKAVTPKKLSFTTDSENIFDYETMQYGRLCDNYGTFSDSTTYDISDYIDISNKPYLVLSKSETYMLFDANKTFMEYKTSTKIYNASLTYKYVIIRFLKSDAVDYTKFMLTDGIQGNDYISHKKIDKSLLERSYVDFTRTENLIDNRKIIYNAKFTNGSVTYNNVGYAVTDFIPIEYAIKYVTNYNATIYQFDENKVAKATKIVTAGTPFMESVATYKYWVIEFSTVSTDIIDFMLIKGNTLPNYFIPYKYVSNVYTPKKLSELENDMGFMDNKTNYYGKKWVSYGDSITGQNKWQPTVASYFGLNHTNQGHGGYPVAVVDNSNIGFALSSDYMLGQLSTYLNGVDIITIMGGTNDFNYDGSGANASYNAIPLGDCSYPYNTKTFKGALSYIINYLVTNYPNLQIVLMSQVGGETKVAGQNITAPLTNALGLTPENFAKATQEVAHYFSIPFIDIFGKSGINHLNSATYIADGVHPNDAGGKKMSQVVIGGLKEIEPLI